MMNQDNKRELSSSSVEELDDKRQKLDTEMAGEDVPAWARSIMSDVAFTRNTCNQIAIDVNEIKRDIVKLEKKVDAVGERCELFDGRFEAMEVRIGKLEKDVAEERSEKETLEAKLAKSTDNQLRDNLSFHNIPQSGPEKWTYTKRLLAKFLAKEMAGPADDIVKIEAETTAWCSKLERAHRGKTNVIHAAFESWVHAEEVRDFFASKQGKIGPKRDIFIMDTFSDHTLERRKLASAYRDNYRKNHLGVKIWTKYPATLMAKHVGELRYNPIANF